MSKVLVEVVRSPSGQLVFIGAGSVGGTYVLRIRVNKRLNISFGRFKGGKKIVVTPGDYVYIGSALAERGACCLAKRLVRHATRTGKKQPHLIREVMRKEFSSVGLGSDDLRPKAGKHLRWNIDYLLDEPSVELVAAYLIRSRLRLEGELGKLLENDPETVVFERGLGANDIPNNTHLLRVAANDDWWQCLPAKLSGLVRDSKNPAAPVALLTDRQRAKLKNMHCCRRRAIRSRMQRGMSFSAAEMATRHVFDTVGWHEVVSRLRRARGMINGIGELLSDDKPLRQANLFGGPV